MKIISTISSFLRNNKEGKAGLLITIIFHLIIVIVLLAYSIHYQIRQETSFVLDFSGAEEKEKARKIEEMKESVSRELDALINGTQKVQNVRNVAVDASKPLKDDRNSSQDAEKLYEEAKNLQAKLDKAREEMEDAADSESDVKIERKDKKDRKADAYKGPSVISYTLDGRKAMSLPVPAYKCIGAGDVSVSIIVNRNGYVVGCRVIEGVSSTDKCLRDYALKAASRSRFASSASAPERQGGEIVYRFVAQ